MPKFLELFISSYGISLLFSIQNVLSQNSLLIVYNFLVLELFFPPITIIVSHFCAKSLQEFCLSKVALQIVLWKLIFSYFFKCCSFFLNSSKSFEINASSLHHPFIPTISG